MNMKKSPLAIAVGTSLFSGLVATSAQADSMVNNEENPFSITELSNGYMFVAQADKKEKGNMKMKDGACGQGQCGAAMMSEDAMEKTAEGKCAGNKPMAKEKKEKMKGMEGKCGEGKCGDNMK